jgi:glucokinase
MILAGDIGGTKTRLGLFEVKGDALIPNMEVTYPSAQFTDLDAIVTDWVKKENLKVRAACFGVAGPVSDGVVVTTNLPWTVRADSLSRSLGGIPVRLINDVEAHAYGIPYVTAEETITFNEGNPPAAGGNAALLAPGTGLGLAGMYWDGTRYWAFATEGGHASFSPVEEIEIELLCYMRKTYPQVSWERVLSGPGLVHIYEFLRDTGHGAEPEWLTEKLSTAADKAAIIADNAYEDKSELCYKTLLLFAQLLGVEASNVALKLMTRGGIYISGGILPKILDRFDQALFMKAFLNNGRMRDLLADMPVKLILNDRIALSGAARVASSERNLWRADGCCCEGSDT